MKKVYILVINLVIFIILAYIVKFISLYVFLFFEYNSLSFDKNWVEVFQEVIEIMKITNYKQVYDNDIPRPIENENSSGKPILILGCSFAKGVSMKSLRDNETFSYRLGKILKHKRPVYNWAMGSQGLQAMIYKVESDNVVWKQKPEYIIYCLIEDQIRRLYIGCSPSPSEKTAYYKKGKDNKLKLITSPIYYSYPADFIRHFVLRNVIYDKRSSEEKLDFLKLHFLKLKDIAEAKYGKTNWIILYYDYNDSDIDVSELENYGFKVVKVSSLVPDGFFKNVKYKVSETDDHPSKYAWEIITPKLYEKMKQMYNFD